MSCARGNFGEKEKKRKKGGTPLSFLSAELAPHLSMRVIAVVLLHAAVIRSLARLVNRSSSAPSSSAMLLCSFNASSEK
jgi:hypothetical protein